MVFLQGVASGIWQCILVHFWMLAKMLAFIFMNSIDADLFQYKSIFLAQIYSKGFSLNQVHMGSLGGGIC